MSKVTIPVDPNRHVVGMVFKSANVRWSAFFRGTELRSRVGNREARLQLVAPPRMFNEDLAQIFVTVIAAAAAQSRGPNAEAVAKAELVLASEAVIETLRDQMATLSSSAMNMRVPDTRARAVFHDRVRVRGLAEQAPSMHDTVLDLDVKRWGWPVADGTQSVNADDLRLWADFLGGVEFLHLDPGAHDEGGLAVHPVPVGRHDHRAIRQDFHAGIGRVVPLLVV